MDHSDQRIINDAPVLKHISMLHSLTYLEIRRIHVCDKTSFHTIWKSYKEWACLNPEYIQEQTIKTINLVLCRAQCFKLATDLTPLLSFKLKMRAYPRQVSTAPAKMTEMHLSANVMQDSRASFATVGLQLWYCCLFASGYTR